MLHLSFNVHQCLKDVSLALKQSGTSPWQLLWRFYKNKKNTTTNFKDHECLIVHSIPADAAKRFKLHEMCCCCFRLTYAAKWLTQCRPTWATWGGTMWLRHTSQNMLAARPKKMAKPMSLNIRSIWQGYEVESQDLQSWPKQIWPDQLMSSYVLNRCFIVLSFTYARNRINKYNRSKWKVIPFSTGDSYCFYENVWQYRGNGL